MSGNPNVDSASLVLVGADGCHFYVNRSRNNIVTLQHNTVKKKLPKWQKVDQHTHSAISYETPSGRSIYYMTRCTLGGRENDRTVRHERAAHRSVPTENGKAHEDA